MVLFDKFQWPLNVSVMKYQLRILFLFRLIDSLLPGDKKIDFSKKTFQPTTNAAFTAARERERIGIFLQKCHQYGIPDTNTFQTDYLYERQNLVQVCTCIRALGIEVSLFRC